MAGTGRLRGWRASGSGNRVAAASCSAWATGWAGLRSPWVGASCEPGKVDCSAKAAAEHPRLVAFPAAAVCPGEADRSCRLWGAAASGRGRQPWETHDLSQRLETAAPRFSFRFISALAIAPFFWLKGVEAIFSKGYFSRVFFAVLIFKNLKAFFFPPASSSERSELCPIVESPVSHAIPLEHLKMWLLTV